jgi:Outer membrane protein beta-barrel domain
MNPFMKRSAVILILLFFYAASGIAQIRLGIRGGIYSTRIKDLNEGIYEIAFNGIPKMGYHVGIIGQAELGGVIIQPELLYCDIRNDIEKGNDLTELEIKKIDLPVMLGYKWGAFKLMAGPVASVVLDDNGDLPAFTNYELLLSQATIGYQAGFGFDISQLSLDFKYEGNLSKWFDGIKINGDVSAFDARPNQFLFSIGLFFGKQR